jgi:hypothetical protein
MVFVKLPGVLDVTLIAIVQDPDVDPACAGMLPPISNKLVPPGAAVIVPPHELDRPAGFAIVIPAGKLSVNAAFVNTNGFGLEMDTLSRETPPDVMTSGEKLLTISAETPTTSVAVIVADGVNVIVGGCGVNVCVAVGVIGVLVGVRLGVRLAVLVLVGLPLTVAVRVAVAVIVDDGVNVIVGG